MFLVQIYYVHYFINAYSIFFNIWTSQAMILSVENVCPLDIVYEGMWFLGVLFAYILYILQIHWTCMSSSFQVLTSVRFCLLIYNNKYPGQNSHFLFHPMKDFIWSIPENEIARYYHGPWIWYENDK